MWGIVLSLMFLFARYIIVLLISIGSRTLLANNKGILTVMLPRGLAADVLAGIVVTTEIPNASAYPDIVTAIMLATVVMASIGILIFARKFPQ